MSPDNNLLNNFLPQLDNLSALPAKIWKTTEGSASSKPVRKSKTKK